MKKYLHNEYVYICGFGNPYQYDKQGVGMKKFLRMKSKIQGIKYFLTVVCVLMLALVVKVKKENILNVQKTVPIASKYNDRKKFTSVEVMHGDTLWSIAEDNKTGNYTTKELVEEIKHANGLKGDKIITGNYLIVPYYD